MKTIIHNTELLFWDTVMNMMSQSKWVQNAIRIVYPIIQGIDQVKLLKTLAITGLSGFITGWFLYYLAQMF